MSGDDQMTRLRRFIRAMLEGAFLGLGEKP